MVKTFICKICGISFKKETRSYAYYCPECKKNKNVEKAMKAKKKRIPSTQIGVGSGGNQKGTNNHMYKDGRGIYKKLYEEYYPLETNKCKICGSRRKLVIHHRNGNRNDNTKRNLIKICRSCHSRVHDLSKNFLNSRSKTRSKR